MTFGYPRKTAEHKVTEGVSTAVALSWDVLAVHPLLGADPTDGRPDYARVDASVRHTSSFWIELDPVRSASDVASHPRKRRRVHIAFVDSGKPLQLCATSRLD